MSVVKKSVPKSHLFNKKDLALYELGYIFSDCSVWFDSKMDKRIATFDLIIRDMPKNRNFLVFCGIEEIVDAIKDWHYSKEDIKELLKIGVISKNFAKYLNNFKFSGEIYSMREGTIFFPGEPVIRVTAPIIEASIIGAFLSTAVFSNTIFSSKAIRSVIAANGKPVIGSISHRVHAFESSLKCARASFICGATGGTAMPIFSKKYNLGIKEPALNLACHAYITSFPTELEAMRKITTRFGAAALMVDTYNFDKGLDNAIKVGLEMKQKNKDLFGILLDSGDIYELSVKTRKRLDSFGLNNTKILVAGNLEENRIHELEMKKAPIDTYLAVTEVATVYDDPKLETIYKLAEIENKGKVSFCAKFAPGKQTYPGKKQVFREYKSGKFSKDVIGLSEEKLGEELLVPVIKNGKVIYHYPNLWEIREFVKLQLSKLPNNLLSIKEQHNYLLEYSEKIKVLTEEIRKKHC